MREILVSIYLIHVKIWFSFFKLFPTKKKTVLVSSFGDNIYFVWKEVLEKTDDDVVILKIPGSKGNFIPNPRTKVIH